MLPMLGEIGAAPTQSMVVRPCGARCGMGRCGDDGAMREKVDEFLRSR
jgi:hypothetical protein